MDRPPCMGPISWNPFHSQIKFSELFTLFFKSQQIHRFEILLKSGQMCCGKCKKCSALIMCRWPESEFTQNIYTEFYMWMTNCNKKGRPSPSLTGAFPVSGTVGDCQDSDVIWTSLVFKSLATRLFSQQIYQDDNKEIMKDYITSPLYLEFTSLHCCGLLTQYGVFTIIDTDNTRAPSQYKDHLSQVWGFPC